MMGTALSRLAIVVAGGGEGIDDFAIGEGDAGVGRIRWNDVYCAGCEQDFFATDDHFELSFDNVGDLFVGVMVFGGDAAFFDIPKCEGALVAVDHFAKEAWQGVLCGYIIEVLHVQFYMKLGKECG
jgi:hypothetical protein